MGATRREPRRRLRRIVSAVLVGILAVFGAGALVVSGSGPPAYAVNPLTNDIAEFTPITHSPFVFTGTADPGDPVTVTSGVSNPCNTVTDGAGNWSCPVVFTASTDATVVTATRPDDGTPAQDSEGWEYAVALPVVINETQPGQILTNNVAAPVTGSGAWPTATMIVVIGGFPCTGGPADGSGNWSCTPSGLLGPGTHVLSASQDVGGATSDVTNSSYILDTSTFIPDFQTPFDTTLPAGSVATSDSTPLVTGGPGDAEPFGTVHVYADDRGLLPVAHPATDPGILYCNAVADGAGAWACSGPVLNVNHYYVFGSGQTDQVGNSTGSPDDEFDLHILPPPAAPTVGSFGLPGELSPIDVNGSVDGVTTQVTVFDGATDLCGPIAPGGGFYTCPGAVPLAPGAHTLDVTAYDIYGTGTTTSVPVLIWGIPVFDTPLAGSSTSASTVPVTGDSPVGSPLIVDISGTGQPGCTGVVAGIPEFSCTSTFLAPGNYTAHAQYTDPNGDPSGVVNRNFTIVAPLNAPAVNQPIIGYSSTDPVVHIDMFNEPEGFSYVQEGATPLCAPVALVIGSFSCDTIPLSVGAHVLDIAQYDQYGTLSTVAHRNVTILPSPVPKPLSMKVFGFSFRVINPDGSPIDPAGLGTGDMVTIEATGVPPGTRLITEIHSTPIELGTRTVGQNGLMRLTTTVPVVPPGPHQIVVTASGDGYFPAAFSQPFSVHGLKQITNPEDAVKQLGEPDEDKELGQPTDAEPTGGTGGGGNVGGGGLEDPTVFGSSVESPFDADAHAFQLTAAGVALTGSLAIAFLLIVGLPAELLESTIRSNYDRAFGWLARFRRRVGKILAPVARLLANPWIGSGLTILAASVLLGFADPGFGFNGASVRLTLAMLLAIIAINVGLTAVVMRIAHRAFDVRSMLQPMPAALALVGISVLVSRLAGISPGFLFGVVLGVVYARELRLRDEGRLGALGVGLTIAAGLLAWLGYGIASTAAGPGFWNNLAIETFAAITLEALGTLVIALLPIEFLDGRTIFRWSKAAWIGLYAATLVVFLFVVVPMSGNWGTMSAPIFGWGTLFVVFGVVAIATWAIFRRLPAKRADGEGATPSSRQGAAAPPRSRR